LMRACGGMFYREVITTIAVLMRTNAHTRNEYGTVPPRVCHGDIMWPSFG